jgi:hypothetical protein
MAVFSNRMSEIKPIARIAAAALTPTAEKDHSCSIPEAAFRHGDHAVFPALLSMSRLALPGP